VGHALSSNDMLNLDEVWAKGALSAQRPRIEAILQRWATVPA
jgi:hypothetical protein